MRSGRVSSQELLRLLAEVSQPIYVLDEQRRIVFANQALAKWLNLPAGDLVGRSCQYQSVDTDPMAALANALCPPPETFFGQTVATTISGSGARPFEPRHTQFIPLPGEDDNWVGVLALVDVQAKTNGEHDSSFTNESQRLHALVQQFRHEMAHRHQIERLAGTSPAMARVREQIKLAGSGAATVLIIGPPGIGRQHVARTLHAVASKTADALNSNGDTTNQTSPFVPVSCSTLPPDVLASTLSTLGNRRTLAATTPTSTLFLADIDRLPPELQTEMLRWLNAGLRSFRLISASTDPLDLLAQRGAFRADLAQQLSTLIITLPSLADRREDIPLLAQMLLEDLNAKGGKQLRGFNAEALDRLALYDWPGQTDELAAVVRESFAQAEGFEITPADLPKKLRLAAEAARFPRQPPEPIELERFLARVECELIKRALRHAKGNKTQAARLLGMTRPRLYRRMEELGLEATDEE